MSSQPHRSVPGLTPAASQQVVQALTPRLAAALDLELTLKHVHWNLVGPGFIAVHEMLDEEVVKVRDMVDAIAERMRTLGGEPNGTPGGIIANRDWDDYGLGRANVYAHLRELDQVYDGVITDHRRAMDAVADLDRVTEDMLIGQVAAMELFQWFVRSFLERSDDDGRIDQVSPRTRASERRTFGARKDAGPMPTADEERAADEAAGTVDLDRVEENYREMTSAGASVEGEGRI